MTEYRLKSVITHLGVFAQGGVGGEEVEAETGTDAPRPPAALFRRGAADAHIFERGHVPYGVVPEIGFQRGKIMVHATA